MVARLATYRFRVDANDLAKKAAGGLLPIFNKQPGFRDYSLFARAWVDENMSDELEWTDTEFVDVLVSTSFGISPS
jgi:hypothetical protein